MYEKIQKKQHCHFTAIIVLHLSLITWHPTHTALACKSEKMDGWICFVGKLWKM